MSNIDILIGIVYLAFLAIYVYSQKNKLAKGKLEEKFFLRAFWFKIIGVTFFVLIYVYYYEGGDTTVYHECCGRLMRLAFSDFDIALKFIFTDDQYAFQKFRYFELGQCNWMAKYGSREMVFVKFSAFINLLALNSYLSISYIYATVSFFASWRLYTVFAHSFPHLKKQLLYASLFVPTVAFWGTGLMKDTLTYIALCYLIFYILNGIILRKNILKSVFYIIINSSIIIILKGYILLAFLPAGITWIFLSYNYLINSNVLRFIAAPFFLILSIITIFFLVKTIGSSLDKFSLDKIQETAEGFQRWHNAASKDGANYTLNFDGFSTTSMIKVFPQAINVTYFRPYLWEAKSVVSLISAFEALGFFLIFIYAVFIKAKVFGIIKVVTSHPLIVMCLIFTLLFGYVVGLTSYNFGALSRYKIPAMPIFAILLVLISNHNVILNPKKNAR